VTTDEIPDPRKLTLTTRLNGAVMQHESVGELASTCRSSSILLMWTQPEPGDVIVTGTRRRCRRKPPV
jgi:2-keto-4-pentenoate hydratase/2-oxohepta-3-ene-1,7-dioic acid hydratase in catechol pathway